MSIWITRAREQGEAMAKVMKHPTIVAPVHRIVYRKPVIEGSYDAIITTSQHGAVGIAQFHDLPLYTVGEQSAKVAKANGFMLATAMAEDAIGLVAMLVSAHTKPMRFLYLSGSEVRVDIAKLLQGHGHQVSRVITYDTIQEDILPDAFIAAWKAGTINGVVFLSIGAVKAAGALLAQHDLDLSVCKRIPAFCISLAVAEAAGALPWAAIHTSTRTTQQSLIEAIDSTITP